MANAFTELQTRRHWADYAPTGTIAKSQASDLIDLAEFAIGRLDAAGDEERRNFLAYLMLPVRA